MHPTHDQPFDGSHDREIETLTEFDEVVAAGRPLARHRVQSVDLTGRTEVLLAQDCAGAVFLGCPMTPDAAAHVRASGALVFPPVPGLPFDPYRGLVYSPDELYDGLAAGGYEVTPEGVYCRRRLAIAPAEQRRHGLANAVARLHFPRITDPAHRNGVLSGLFLARRLISYEYGKRLNDGTPSTAGVVARLEF